MSTLVAYYLSELAPDGERRETVTKDDLEKYFKQAQYPLPNQLRFTLRNAATAGYLDGLGDGVYKLNPVGHNLVVHSLPSPAAASRPKRATKPRATKARGSAKSKPTAKATSTATRSRSTKK